MKLTWKVANSDLKLCWFFVFKIWNSRNILIQVQLSWTTYKWLINAIICMLRQIFSRLGLIFTTKILSICSKSPWNLWTHQHFLVQFFHRFFDSRQNSSSLDLVIFPGYRVRADLPGNVPVLKCLFNRLVCNQIIYLNKTGTLWINSTQNYVQLSGLILKHIR